MNRENGNRLLQEIARKPNAKALFSFHQKRKGAGGSTNGCAANIRIGGKADLRASQVRSVNQFRHQAMGSAMPFSHNA
jgi:hypothetical protein